jgi:hypothetical protein
MGASSHRVQVQQQALQTQVVLAVGLVVSFSLLPKP